MAEIRIAIIDDHPLFREGVARSLAEIGGFEIVGEGSCCEDALRIATRHAPDIVLLDISMPGGGLQALGQILEVLPGQKVVMLTVSETGEDVTRALRCGARGYVLKGVGSRALADILQSVAAGKSYVSPDLSARLIADLSAERVSDGQSGSLATLTEREAQILGLVASGLSNKRVALRLGLQEKTVKHHMTHILAKLNVTNRTEAALAFRDARGG